MFKQFIKQTPFGVSLLLMVLTAAVVALILPINGSKSLIVRSGSMEPAIKTGDLVVVRPAENYKAGDIIAFKDPAKQSITVTHRIAGIKPQNGNVFYKTRGDANEEADFNLVPQNNVIGKARYSIKGIGKIFAFSKTKEGFITLAAIPALFVIILETLNIVKEIKKSKNKSPKYIYRQTLKHLYHHYGKPMGVAHPSASLKSALIVLSGKWKKNKVSVRRHVAFNSRGISFRAVLPILASLLIVGNTFSFFSDTETSTGNLFQAASVFPTPTPTPTPSPTPPPIANHVVINEVYYDPDNDHQISGQGGENRGEWVEIYNPTGSSVDLSNWTIEDNDGVSGAETLSGLLPAGGFLILTGATSSEIQAEWTIPSGTLFNQADNGTIGNGFNNGGDRVVLKDNNGIVIDQMSYGTDTAALNPPETDVTSGHSLERNPDGVDTNTNADFADTNPPTPGT